jgi:hypothetical protein
MLDLVKEEEEEAGGVWVVIDGSSALLEEFDGLEHILLAETSKAEALEPRTLAEAKCCPDWLWWEKAIGKELATLEAARTWILEEPPPEANIISSKWVFKAKKDATASSPNSRLTWWHKGSVRSIVSITTTPTHLWPNFPPLEPLLPWLTA